MIESTIGMVIQGQCLIHGMFHPRLWEGAEYSDGSGTVLEFVICVFGPCRQGSPDRTPRQDVLLGVSSSGLSMRVVFL